MVIMSDRMSDKVSYKYQISCYTGSGGETAMPTHANRRKISTTVAPETDAFLKSLVRRGKAANLAEAVDRAVAIARRAESRKKLEAATADYYESLSKENIAEDSALGLTLAYESGNVTSMSDAYPLWPVSHRGEIWTA